MDGKTIRVSCGTPIANPNHVRAEGDGASWSSPKRSALSQTIKHHDKHGHLLSVEIRATMENSLGPAGTVHLERLNGALRDRLNALTEHFACLCQT
jgi:hypothetical protein